MCFARRCLAALACVAACHTAQAERLRLTEESDVFEPGDCEVEAGFERKAARGAAKEHESAVQLVCGIGWQTELTGAFAHKRSGAEREQAIGIEAKTALRERATDRLGWALTYGLGAERAGGESWRRSEHYIAVEATLQPGSDWLIEATLGTARDHRARRNSTLWELAVEHALSETVEARAEASGDDRSRPLLSVTLQYLFWPEEDGLVKLTYGVRPGPLRERHLGIGIVYEF